MIDKKIKKDFTDDEVRMILQVHDELVFEVKKEASSKAAKMIQETMENVYTLRVPIVVDVETGENWGETE